MPLVFEIYVDLKYPIHIRNEQGKQRPVPIVAKHYLKVVTILWSHQGLKIKDCIW